IAACWHHVRTLQARTLAGEHAAALEAASKAAALLWSSTSFFETAEFYFYRALALAAGHDAAPPAERAARMSALLADLEVLERWAASSPASFRDRAALVGAEVARLRGEVERAEQLF